MKTRKSNSSRRKSMKKGPDSVSDVIRTKTMDEVLEIEPLVLSDYGSNRSEGLNHAIADYVIESRRVEEDIRRGEKVITTPILHVKSQRSMQMKKSGKTIEQDVKTNVVRSVQTGDLIAEKEKKLEEQKPMIKINEEDIEEEAEF